MALVNLYWNIGRIVTQDIQKNEKRAGYGEQLLESLAEALSREYGKGYSQANLQDMRRFFETFEICQTVSNKFPSDPIRQTLSSESSDGQILQTISGESSDAKILQALPAESSDCILIDFRHHFHLGWSHYRLLLSQSDPLKRKFYFEQTTIQRWSVRELQRQIEGALFERVALSRNTRKLAALEKRKGPPEVDRYEDIFKDPYQPWPEKIFIDSLNSAIGQGFIHRVSGTGSIGSLLHDGKVNIEIKKEAPPPPTPPATPGRIMTNTVILSPAEVQNLGEEIAQLTKALAGCDPQVEARISIKSKPDKNLNKANEILEKIKQKWRF